MLRDFAALFRASRTAALLVALVAVPLAGCGIKGPLKLPADKIAPTAPTSNSPAIRSLPAESLTPTDPQDRERKP